MSKCLIIVESPAKVKTIKKFLGDNYNVKASIGHIRDLPSSKLGIDEAHDYEPNYQIIKGKEKVVKELQSAASHSDIIYLAPDPDREGEAIAWHILQILKNKHKDVKRIEFNEITSSAVKTALEHPREINLDLFDAQQARRVLDRLVGYKISPLLWKTVKRNISAGRVQSVALRLIVEREEERFKFTPYEYWTFKSTLTNLKGNFKSELIRFSQKYTDYLRDKYCKGSDSPIATSKLPITCKDAADEVEQVIRNNDFSILKIEEKERVKSPNPPFTTSTLQQSANQILGFTSKRTMMAAQRLYEGIELGSRGTTALITYMRTDSVRIADEARVATTSYIRSTYGEKYMYPGGNGKIYASKSNIQDAHEAIRPVNISVTPDSVKYYLTDDQYKVYSLIWSRFIASQMSSAIYHDTVVTLTCGPTVWRTKGTKVEFSGYLIVYTTPDESVARLPDIKYNDEVKLVELLKEQKYTQPTPRYTEAGLVKELEELGIGRPSTYAAIISTIQERGYVKLVDKHFIPTDLGTVVCDKLREHFSKLVDTNFTAQMEKDLDSVADGKLNWVALIRNFTNYLNPALKEAEASMEVVKMGIQTDKICPLCGHKLVIKFGRNGEFLSCSNYPECKYTANFTRDSSGSIEVQEHQKVEEVKMGTCPKCGHDLVLRSSRLGVRYLKCSSPDCKYTESYSTGVHCPECKKGMLMERSTKKGRKFYACNRYPECSYSVWSYPVEEPCPTCGYPILLKRFNKTKGEYLSCPKCQYTKDIDTTN